MNHRNVEEIKHKIKGLKHIDEYECTLTNNDCIELIISYRVFKLARVKYMTTKFQNARNSHFEHYEGNGKVTICIIW